MMRIAGPLPGQRLNENSYKHTAEQPRSSGPVAIRKSADSGMVLFVTDKVGVACYYLHILTMLKVFFSKISLKQLVS